MPFEPLLLWCSALSNQPMVPVTLRRSVGGAGVSRRCLGCCPRRWGPRQCQLCCQSLVVVGLVGHGCVAFGCDLELGVSAGSVRSYVTSVAVFV